MKVSTFGGALHGDGKSRVGGRCDKLRQDPVPALRRERPRAAGALQFALFRSRIGRRLEPELVQHCQQLLGVQPRHPVISPCPRESLLFTRALLAGRVSVPIQRGARADQMLVQCVR